MRTWIVLAVACLLVACATGQSIYLVNADGKRVQCGPYQTAALPYASLVAAATISNNQMKDCVTKYQMAGYTLDIPERPIKVIAYPAQGPLLEKGYRGPIEALLVAQGTKGRFGFVRPDGVSCEGHFTTMQGTAPNRLIVKYGDIVGVRVNTDKMVPGVAFGTCSNNASFQAEYYIVSGTDNGIGVAADSDGNVFKLMTE